MNAYEESIRYEKESMNVRESVRNNEESDSTSHKVEVMRRFTSSRRCCGRIDTEYKDASKEANVTQRTKPLCQSPVEDELMSYHERSDVKSKTSSLDPKYYNDCVVDNPKGQKNPLLLNALEELNRSLIEGDVQKMAQSWNSLGLVRLHTQLDPHEAIRCHKNALQLLQTSPSMDVTTTSHPSTTIVTGTNSHALELAATFHDLGLCYERLNDMNEAMKSYLHARDILSSKNLLIDSHPQTLALNRAIERIQKFCSFDIK